MNQLQQYIHKSKYARRVEGTRRRESYTETVQRYFTFFTNYLHIDFDPNLYNMALDFDALPSMRGFMTAGPALARDPNAIYNCVYLPVDDIRAFSETMFCLACGSGVGFSVERQFICKLPTVAETFQKSSTCLVVDDDKIGWCEALRELIALLYNGRIPSWDTTKVRPRGSPLKTFGGTASGPEPLEALFRALVQIFTNARGRKLTSIECHDIQCLIGDSIISGGVRRSALLSLSNLSDLRMRTAKSGDWHVIAPHRTLANNSVAYTEKPDVGAFMEEWLALYRSQSGERGIFNRAAMINKIKARRKIEQDNETIQFGVNPCGEIIMRPHQFCNLSTIIAREDDTPNTLEQKAVAAATFGTWQSALTDFRYLRKIWQQNCEEERLLGVSITGIMDCPLLNTLNKETEELLEHLKQTVIETNIKIAKQIGINPSLGTTCVKPEGTLSQLVNSSSGIHARYSQYYFRRVIENNHDPLCKFLKTNGFPYEPSITKDTQTVFVFPVKSPDNALVQDDLNELFILEHWRMFRDHWCEHNPSITVNVNEHMWPTVGAWVYENFDNIGGIAFLPKTNHVYKQTPFEAISKDQYEEHVARTPDLDWDRLTEYETDEDTTQKDPEYCGGDTCTIG